MCSDAFTLDMFGGTSLSSGLSLGVTAFGGFAANDDDPDPTPPSPAPAIALPAGKSAPHKRGLRANLYLDDGNRGLAATWKERAKAKVAAIMIANEIGRQDRAATREEEVQLVRFAGFGSSELANGMFRPPGAAAVCWSRVSEPDCLRR